VKRDMDLVREVLLRVEEDTSGSIKHLELDGFTPEEVAYHIVLLVEHGYLVGGVQPTVGNRPPIYIVQRMSWDGHEFLDLARNKTIWKEAKKTFVEKGAALSLEVLKVVLIELTRRALLA